VPALYIVAASAIMLVLLLYRTNTSWPGLLIVLTGVPVYFLWKGRSTGTRVTTPDLDSPEGGA
jgi:APA family basic amino acid/polyamine antiporter